MTDLASELSRSRTLPALAHAFNRKAPTVVNSIMLHRGNSRPLIELEAHFVKTTASMPEHADVAWSDWLVDRRHGRHRRTRQGSLLSISLAMTILGLAVIASVLRLLI
ncbi:hypothetical protein SAMN07250955_11298 [Arboricoccus pini]|uniref:Uncharacterized protein n=1 Tax=Arboricoccus pini TaxID=1963835 RepID=A0A212RRM3_9PROT|nr:hypothetical protein SAMN07250955_11298 [Arboricoccus pini]